VIHESDEYFQEKKTFHFGQKEYLLEKGLLMSKDFEGIQDDELESAKMFFMTRCPGIKNNVSSRNIRHRSLHIKKR
jgi:hypothetical protein